LPHLFTDTTTLEKNIAYPTEIGLLTRVIEEGQAVVQKVMYKKDIVVTKVIKKAKKIAKVYYSASKKTKKLLKDTSKALFTIAKKQIEDASCVVNEIGIVILKSTAKRYKKLKETGEKIIDQIEAKLKGKKVVNRIVSYYEDHSRALPKGKISKPCEFGLKLRLDMSKNGYITNHKLYTKNIAGINIIEESVKSHTKVFGRKFSGGAADKVEILFSSSTCCNIKYNSSCKHGGSDYVLVGYINAHKVHAAC